MILLRPSRIPVLSSFLFFLLTLLSAPAHATTGTTKSASAPSTAATTVLRGRASWYGSYFQGKRTTSGERYNRNKYTCAHKTLPFGTRLRVTNVASGQSVTVRVNDRGPFVRGRVVDVSYAAAEELGMVGGGVAKVKLDVVQ
jgi:rare lipoprotein A